MIGLFFIFVVVLWLLIAAALGIKIPKWLGVKRYRPAISFALVVAIFFAPIGDEIIAYPQLQSLCTAGGYELGMDERSAYGRTIYYTAHEKLDALWPPSVIVARLEVNYVDATTKQPVVIWRGVRPVRGFLGIPAGSSGSKMTALLRNCKPKDIPLDRQGIPLRLSHLNLVKVATP